MQYLSKSVLRSYRILFDRILSLQADGWKCLPFNAGRFTACEKVWLLSRDDRRILMYFNSETGEAAQYSLHRDWF